MNLLEVKNICKTYGSGETAVKALKDVSFSVPKGEYVAVVGESGSGKSTLLNMIGALDTPTTGKVLIDGKDIFAMDERKLTVFRRRNIGFIFQAFNLVPELTVEQNIIFPVLLDYQKPDKKYLEERATKYQSVAYEIGAKIQEMTGQEIRVTVPGHMQRGGAPVPFDRVLSSRIGAHAAAMIERGDFGKLVVVKNNVITDIPLEESAGKLKHVDPQSVIIKEAKLLGISFGDK